MRTPQKGRGVSPLHGGAIALIVSAASLLLSSNAGAFVVGHVESPVPFDCTGPSTYLQEATGATSFTYTVPAGGGLISSWQTQGGTSSGAQVKLAVFRPTGVPSQFTTIGSSAAQTIQAGQRNQADAQIPVSGGETIGLLILSGTHQCALDAGAANIGQRDDAAVHDTGTTFTYSDPNPGSSINVRADVTPAPRTLTLRANKKQVRRGKKVRLSGQVSSVNSEVCAGGQAVTVERKLAGKKGKMSPIAEARTDSRGNFSIKSRVRTTSKFRAEVAQTPSCGSAESKRKTVKTAV